MDKRIYMEILIKEYIAAEDTPEATKIKYYLILDLINRPIKYVPVINYYYDIKER